MPINYATEAYFLTIGMCGLIHLALSLIVIRKRRQLKTLLGHDDNRDLQAAIRAHANFCEYTPISLILIGLFTFLDPHIDLVFCICLLFIISRLLHMASLLHFERLHIPTIRYRFFATLINLIVILATSLFVIIDMLTNSFNHY